MKSAEHERTTARLVRAMVVGFAGQHDTQVAYGHDNLWEGASGFSHQIDVTVEWPGERLILVECKWRSPERSNVVASDALALLGRLIDIRDRLPHDNVQAMLVTNKPVQEGVETICNYYNIGLNRVDSSKEFCIEFRPHGDPIRKIPLVVSLGVTDGGVVSDDASVVVKPAEPQSK